MGERPDRTVLTEAVDASLSFRADSWGIAGFALLLLGGSLYLLLGWFADGDCLCDRWTNLTCRPAALTWFLVIGAIIARLLFAVAGSRIMQAAAAGITGSPEEGRDPWPRVWRQIRADFWDTPRELGTIPFFLLLILAVLLQASRIPYAGRAVFFVLLPVLVYLSLSIVRPHARWLLAGHLIGAGMATEANSAFPAGTTAWAYLARDGLWLVGLRLAAFAYVLGAVLLRAASVVFLGLVACWLAPGLLEGRFGTLMAVLLGWWLLSLLISACYSGRAAQYLILRRTLDGVPLVGTAKVAEEKSLEQMGVELVKRLERSEEE